MDERQGPLGGAGSGRAPGGGDETALVDLYDRYAGFVYGLAVRTLVDRQAAEDVTQEVFVSLWEHPERIESGRGPCAASSARSPIAGRSTPSARRRRAGAGRRGWHGRLAMCPTSPRPCCGRTPPARSTRRSRCCPRRSGRHWSSPTSTDTPTGRSPTCWASRRARRSRGCAWRWRASPRPRFRDERAERTMGMNDESGGLRHRTLQYLRFGRTVMGVEGRSTRPRTVRAVDSLGDW